MLATLCFTSLCVTWACAGAPLRDAFRIQVIDQNTGRGVPAVELRTVDQRRFFTDSAGVIALYEPELMGREVFFEVRSFGYRFAEARLGVRGTTLRVEPGERARLFVFRENVAQRLYRITGADRYRDTRLLGESTPLDRAQRSRPAPADAELVLGLDSAFAEVYRGRLFWVWGDTNTAARPLANLRVTGATSELPQRGGLDPWRGIALDYLRDDGALRPMVDSDHPVVWLSALRVARDERGEEQLFATYAKIGEALRAQEHGLARFDDASGRFELVAAYPKDAPIVPMGHVFRHRTAEGELFHYGLAVRSPTTAQAVATLERYQAFTALRSGRRIGDPDALERDASGRLVWAWKHDAPPIRAEQWRELVAAGAVKEDEAWYRLIDVSTGSALEPHHGSVHFSPYRQRWIMIRSQLGGASPLGEVFYAEADAPLGPWAYAQKIVTHAQPPSALEHSAHAKGEPETLSFYNPVQHPELDRNDGRLVFFEGTLSTAFAKNARPLPGYDYNQMMYALDLEDPRLRLPVAIYRARGADGRWRYGDALALRGFESARELVFFAPDRPRAGTLAMVEEAGAAGARLVLREREDGAFRDAAVRFYCTQEAAPATTPLFESRDPSDGSWIYTTRASDGAKPICRVWSLPVRFPAIVAQPESR